METKKSKKAQIEGHRGTWLLMGVIIVLGLMFVSFEWTRRDVNFSVSAGANDPFFEASMVPITFPEQEPPPPPPPAPSLPDEINVVDNEVEVETNPFRGTEDEGDPVAVVYIAPKAEVDLPVEPDVIDIAEVMPDFPGGVSALNAYLSKNIKYPAICQEENVQGRVIVQFVVDKDGSIINPVVVKGADPHLDREALRVIKAMPKWSPGRQNNKVVRVKYTVPVNFRLQR